MGRPIEFRAWDKVEKKYIYFTLNELIEGYGAEYGFKHIIDFSDANETEQFIGQYDATTWEELTDEERKDWTRHGNTPSEWKGRKIFEGDRVSFAGNITADDSIGFEPNGYMYDETDVHTVVWDKNLLAWNLDFEDDEEMKYKRDTRALLLAGRCKVVGHIHEVSK